MGNRVLCFLKSLLARTGFASIGRICNNTVDRGSFAAWTRADAKQNSSTGPFAIASADSQLFSLYHTEANLAFVRGQMLRYAQIFDGCSSILDLGCGPGVFLQIVEERTGIRGMGVDVDEAMVLATRSKGFECSCGRAEEWLSRVSLRFEGIHAGHIIEHLDGPCAIAFLADCFSHLANGGVLLVRTPNWENERVRNRVFWLDPTHVRPYPLPLLVKMFADTGFTDIGTSVEESRLQDLAIVGRKPGGSL
ncbi:MAG: class I SAM-dependent methyltransferase [Lentisphaerae bacterium]|nr:class I SAM-dependent methyltransferase [Lentisphaerota bacterium]